MGLIDWKTVARKQQAAGTKWEYFNGVYWQKGHCYFTEAQDKYRICDSGSDPDAWRQRNRELQAAGAIFISNIYANSRPMWERCVYDEGFDFNSGTEDQYRMVDVDEWLKRNNELQARDKKRVICFALVRHGVDDPITISADSPTVIYNYCLSTESTVIGTIESRVI